MEDKDGDGALDKQELRDWMCKLASSEKPKNVDALKNTIYSNLKDMVVRKYAAPDSIFLGESDEDRVRWINDCVEEFIVNNWEK